MPATRMSCRSRGRAKRLLLTGLLVVPVILSEAVAASASSLTEFPVAPCSNVVGGLVGIAGGPDNNVWFTDPIGGIERITPSGSSTCFPLSRGAGPNGVVGGPDGNIWFDEEGANKIGRITPSGTLTEFAIPTSSSLMTSARRTSDIAVGPDGNLWFTEFGANQIGRITTTGTFTEFPVPTSGARPIGIASGSDRNLWFTEPGANQIGRITPTGSVTEFVVPTASSGLGAITPGPDGNLWFLETGSNQIGQITPTGAITEFAVPTPNSGLAGITSGPDGNVWFTEDSANQVGRIALTGAIAESPVAAPVGIESGPDGKLWIAESAVKTNLAFAENAVEQMAPWPIPASFSPPALSGSPKQGQTLAESHGTWTNSPFGYTYRWDRCDPISPYCNAIPGATSQTYVLTSADVGRRIRVEETALSTRGAYSDPAISAMTAVVQSALPISTSPPPILGTAPTAIVQARNGTITVGRVRISGTAAGVVLSCSGAAGATCPLTLALTVTETVKGGRVTAVTALKRTPPKAKHKLVLLGTVTITLPAGKSKTVHVALNTAGRQLLAKYHVLKVKLTVSESPTSGKTAITLTKVLTFKRQATKRNH